ncbi:exodeoxyribonuclease VII large subunit [Chryseolinea sp. H1M3-3]|uniref:exodeoxyribonuclease VII large subunit n=1 Tax=Chryseolinea sp. H1M3-3 TaxID=3034144 RepID=UPI0023EB2A9B|nr:exodeoxyribonuclease VII large subunit [Chryseolinea sp. H1M3-3]
MPATINDKKVFSLIEVTLSIQKTIAERYKNSFWVMAEMNKLNYYSHSGHCYPELVEKREGKVIAQLKSNLWKSDFERVNNNFLKVLKEPLKDGIKILFCASISFDPSHGLSLRILDIDPSFSLGELEREKQDTLAQLKKEGIFNANKSLNLPLLPQRMAIISVETSKGYSDFLKIIDHNPWGYKFFKHLFPSLLQGEKSVASICNQLKQIRKVVHHFDVVAIIRGGGGDVGLSSYNDFELAKAIALFPIPVLTGIGHSTNETVAEMVSFKNAITPTELADFLIQKFHHFSNPIKRGEEIIVERARRVLRDEKTKFQNMIRYFRSATNAGLMKSRVEIRSQSESLLQNSKFLIRKNEGLLKWSMVGLEKNVNSQVGACKKQLNELIIETKQITVIQLSKQKDNLLRVEKQVAILDPVNILRRGFSITLYNGVALRSSKEVQAGDKITTIVTDGEIISEVKSSKPE